MKYHEQLEKQVIELRQEIQRREHRERIWKELHLGLKRALWKYSIGKKPDPALSDQIQGWENKLGVGNGVLKDAEQG